MLECKATHDYPDVYTALGMKPKTKAEKKFRFHCALLEKY
jgi:hypothetical protein